jgi:hypothetical protein
LLNAQPGWQKAKVVGAVGVAGAWWAKPLSEGLTEQRKAPVSFILFEHFYFTFILFLTEQRKAPASVTNTRGDF